METHINDIIHVIQLAVAPVVMRSAVGRHAAVDSCRLKILSTAFPIES
jgi:hypothetical protein